jgi:hypothetical protein
MDQMEAIDHLHRLGGPSANAVCIEVTAITADDGDRRMLDEPGRDAGGRAVRQEVDDPMGCEIDEDGAIAMAPPPGPLVDPDGLQGWGARHWGWPHQPELGRRTGRQPQAGCKPGPRRPPRAMPIARRIVISR